MTIELQEILDEITAKIAEVQAKAEAIQARSEALGAGAQTGTERGDFLFAFGFSNNATISGLAGDDRIFGRFGDDELFGGEGDDLIDGGFGNDAILGENGDDVLLGKSGDDFVSGGAGNDIVNGGQGNDQLDGGDGNDQLSGGPDSDILLGGTGADILIGAGGDQVGGSPQQDILIGGTIDANGFPVGDGAPDQYVLGDANGPFYATAGFGDFVNILDFEPGVDGLDLSPSVQHGLLFFDANGDGVIDPSQGDGTDIYALLPDGPDLIASVIGVDLTQGQGVVVV
ncbi:calcium-binding protein [Dapis sp. BLCC M172]|uniref:calcium-binding protein n=1 Tax=Dapis sp. BLCC M172 TaxID=2975281 RepID=UPI003CF0B8BD